NTQKNSQTTHFIIFLLFILFLVFFLLDLLFYQCFFSVNFYLHDSSLDSFLVKHTKPYKKVCLL
ncbi:hypothetical protein KSS87_014642, partial [Heliosperma pusillum]